MSTTTNREPAPHARRPVDHRLARLLDTPLLARLVPHLAPETLHQLVQYRGLDACGDLVTAATPAQLASLLDVDLWRCAQPGGNEDFDVDRFGEWLEMLVDTGDSVAARTVAALDKQLVIVGLSRYLRVFDPGTFEPTAASDDELMDRHEMMNSETSGDLFECEVGGYLVRARRTDAWDAIVTLLGTLDAEYNDCFHAVMQGCRGLSNSRPEIDGLDDLLTVPEQHLHDVAIERERRRSRHGYATPADARALLNAARKTRHTPHGSAIAIDAIATAYFRAAEERADTAPEGITTRSTEAGVMPQPPRALLEASDQVPSTGLGASSRVARLEILKRLMDFVLHHDETAYLARSRELAFLANTLLAGTSVQSRPFTPREAFDAAACICNLGLECWPAGWPGASAAPASAPREVDAAVPANAFLVDHDLVTAFEAGWSALYEDVSLFVADQLITTLANLHRVDDATDGELRALRHELRKQREAGTPWLAREAADVLAMLDTTACISIVGLLDECPILPAALAAVLERRTTPVSPTAFEFISTTSQIGDIRVFMRALPSVLAR
jgi:hypothetical protein